MVSFHCNLQQWKVFLPHVYLEVNIKGDYKVSHDLPRAGRLHWNLGRTFSKPRISVRSIAVSLNTSLGAWSWAPKGNSAPTQLIWDLLALVTSLIYHHRETPSIYFSFLRRLYFKTPFYELVKPSLYVLVENPIKKCLPAPRFLSLFHRRVFLPPSWPVREMEPWSTPNFGNRGLWCRVCKKEHPVLKRKFHNVPLGISRIVIST